MVIAYLHSFQSRATLKITSIVGSVLWKHCGKAQLPWMVEYCGNGEFGLTGKSRTFKKFDSNTLNTEIPPSLSHLSDGLFNRLQCCEECLTGHQDIEPERETHS